MTSSTLNAVTADGPAFMSAEWGIVKRVMHNSPLDLGATNDYFNAYELMLQSLST